MRRVVNLWLALLAVYWLMRAAVASLLFGRVDQGYPALAELLAIPALQAMALAWATRERGALQLALPWREGWRLWPLRGALAVDAGVLAAAWLMPAAYRPSWLAPWPGAGLPAWLTALKLAVAAALLVAALRRRDFRPRERLAVAAVAAALLALAAMPWRGWLAGPLGAPASSPPAAAASPSLRWFGAYGLLTAAALLLVLQAASALRRHSPAAAMAFDWALGLLLVAAGCAALGFVRRPAATAASWDHAAAILGWLSGTALLVGAALAAGGVQGAGRPAGPPAAAAGEPA